MKYIITESQHKKIQALRRLDELWGLIQNLYPWMYPCEFKSLHEFLSSIRYEMTDVLSLDWINSGNENEVWEIVKKVFGDKIIEHYEGWCK